MVVTYGELAEVLLLVIGLYSFTSSLLPGLVALLTVDGQRACLLDVRAGDLRLLLAGRDPVGVHNDAGPASRERLARASAILVAET